jgi:predicted NUDIX family NTP pyrophosphohydrolase
MGKQSAGIMLYRYVDGLPEILLAHPGGPFFAKKDLGAWSIPKGEFDETEEPLEAAKREFFEETGVVVEGEFITLTPIVQKGGKKVFAWAVEQDLDPAAIKSNTFWLEFPPKSGKMIEIPEIDRAEWFPVKTALEKINSAQARLITQLMLKLKKR